MTRTIKLLILVFAVHFCGGDAATQDSSPLATEEVIKKDLETVVCKNDERLAAVKSLFVSKGALEEDIVIDEEGGTRNLVVTKPGKENEIVVVGAHYDQTGGGCGAIDNWTGIVIIANLFKTIKAVNTVKTWKFVAFDREEQGLIGSRKMAQAIPKESRENYCAMLNFDSFGLSYPQVMRNTSDSKLVKVAKEISEEMGFPFAAADIFGADADSSSFRDIKIPSVSIHGLDNKWKNYLHSHNDKVENVKATSVYFGYRFGLSFASRVEKSICRELGPAK